MDKVIHFEIPADNVKRTQDFYKNIFGWKIDEVPGMDYYFVTTVVGQFLAMLFFADLSMIK